MNNGLLHTGLNAAQQDAVKHTEGPLLVLAGAGSGKTRVITSRILHLIEKGIAPKNILAVTFTNKAAKEMRERVIQSIRQSGLSSSWDDIPTVTTFHSFGVRVLRQHHEILGLPKHFAIYDRGDTLRAVKKAVEKAGHNPKEFEPKNMLSMISKAKGDATTRADYKANARSYGARIAGEIWEHYEDIMRDEGALDFDDLLVKTLNLLKSNPDILKSYHDIYRYIHVDEFQDTNKIQMEIIQLLAAHQNICVVGDVDQCLVKGTAVTLADGSTRAIEKIKVGDKVLSSYGSGDFRPAEVTHTHASSKQTGITRIETESGKVLESTSEHVHFAGYSHGTTPQQFFVYLMYKKGFGYRIGTTCFYTKGQKKQIPGFVQRSNQEHADALWILSTHETENEARIHEYILSLTHQVPTLPFVARKGGCKNGYVHSQEAISFIFNTFDLDKNGAQILQEHGLSFDWPHHCPHATGDRRRILNVCLCGDRRGKTPMHRISIGSSDPIMKQILIDGGFSIRQAKANSSAYKFETMYSSFAKIQKITQTIKKLIPDIQIRLTARLGKQSEHIRGKNTLPFIPAEYVRPGMLMFNDQGGYEIVKKVYTTHKKTTVYDINVAHTHNFIANAIITHNSIYSWRGANIANILKFEQCFSNSRTILLEENYRSTKTIIEASNAVIAKNTNRPDKRVFTNNEQGALVTVYTALNGYDEADYIAKESKKLIDRGVSPSDIAVLYRTNSQSRSLEEGMIKACVPYQLLGTKFFERAEVKDILSYLRLALNPGNGGDLARIINVPTRGIGKVTYTKLVEEGKDALTGKARATVDEFYTILDKIAVKAKDSTVSELLKYILDVSGMEAYFLQDGDDGQDRLENIGELVSLSVKYDEFEPQEAIERLLEEAALQSDQDEIQEKEKLDAVRLMTIHASKGLEFPYVFIAGMEEGLFPHKSFDDKQKRDDEEERRLFYVALTRAGKKVYLTHALIRMIFGSENFNDPSSFIGEIPAHLLEQIESKREPSQSGKSSRFGQFDYGNKSSSGYKGKSSSDFGPEKTIWL